MIRCVFKYDISQPGDTVTVSMPVGAKVLHVGMQNRVLRAWADVPDHAAAHESRRFYTAGTGWEVPSDGVFVGTVFDGEYVWHVFELVEP